MRALVVSLLMLLASIGAGAAWLYHQGAFAVKAADKVETAENQAAVANLNTEGVKQSVARVQIVTGTQQSAARLAEKYRAEAQAAKDADAPLDPDRARRLRAADDELCRLNPALDGCGASSGDAGGSAAPVLVPDARRWELPNAVGSGVSLYSPRGGAGGL